MHDLQLSANNFVTAVAWVPPCFVMQVQLTVSDKIFKVNLEN